MRKLFGPLAQPRAAKSTFLIRSALSKAAMLKNRETSTLPAPAMAQCTLAPATSFSWTYPWPGRRESRCTLVTTATMARVIIGPRHGFV